MNTIIENGLNSLNWAIPPENLYAPIGYTLSSGGKRIRPQLVLMGCELFGGDVSKALPVAMAIEIFHNFTLLHDDIMDNADTRRGRVTVHKKWSDNTAILSGDAMMIKAYEQLEQVDADKLPMVLHLFTRMALEICEGQQYDMDYESMDQVAVADYFKMIRLKTAVLLGYSLKLGAVLANGSAADADHLFNFGINIGLAFQLRDDYLDVYGDPKTFGKEVGGDIACGKKTFMWLSALQLAKATDAAFMKGLTANKALTKQEKLEAVTAIYNQLGIPALCEEEMNSYYRLALQELNAIKVENDAKKTLMDLAQKLMGRTD